MARALYEFECRTGCGHRFDGFADPDTIGKTHPCPACGATAERIFTPTKNPESFGKNSYVNRTPLWKQRATDDGDLAYLREKRIEAGAQIVFGQMPGRKDLATA